MLRKTGGVAIAVQLIASFCSPALGQAPPVTVLPIDLQNVAVNGQPAPGIYVGRTRPIVSSPAPTAEGAFADVTRTALREHVFEILQSDSTPVGTIISLGFSGGSSPPRTGGPSVEPADLAGQRRWPKTPPTGGQMEERRSPLSFTLCPCPRRKIVTATGAPAVIHSNDFSPVTASKPAVAGELLSLFATGLGPTIPEVDFGQPFPSDTLATVNSPISVTVTGESAEVLAAVGFPAAVGGYQVNFRMPADATKGPATIQTERRLGYERAGEHYRAVSIDFEQKQGEIL
jgi:hypothetical protein